MEMSSATVDRRTKAHLRKDLQGRGEAAGVPITIHNNHNGDPEHLGNRQGLVERRWAVDEELRFGDLAVAQNKRPIFDALERFERQPSAECRAFKAMRSPCTPQ